jgi:hypothetical protein
MHRGAHRDVDGGRAVGGDGVRGVLAWSHRPGSCAAVRRLEDRRGWRQGLPGGGSGGSVRAARGRRYPAGAHAGAVGRVRPTALCCSVWRSRGRTHCACFAALRSDSARESVHEARKRADLQSCAARALQAAPGTVARLLARHEQSTGLFVSGLGPRNRPSRVPPAASCGVGCPCTKTILPRHLPCLQRGEPTLQQRRVRAVRKAPLRRRGAQAWGRRACAPRRLTRGRCSSAVLRSKRSEFDRATPSRAPQRSRPYPADRRSEAHRPARARLCRAVPCTNFNGIANMCCAAELPT